MTYERNLGSQPPECAIRDSSGKLTGQHPVHVRLFNGWDSKAAGHQPWPAGSADWCISAKPHPFQIEFYEVAT